MEKAKQSIAFEQAMSELESIVRKLESPDTPLDNAINLYERGEELRQICEEKLNNAKLKIEKLVLAKDNNKTKLEEISID